MEEFNLMKGNKAGTGAGEQLYHNMIAEIADYAIILLDINGQIVNWNKGAENIKGYSANEIIGKNFSQFYLHADIESALPNKLLAEAKKNGAARHEGWRVKKDGNVFWGSVVITALHDDNDNVIGYSKVTRDLTERKMAEERMERFTSELQHNNELLQRSEERYHQMIAEVEDYAIILLDVDGKIQNWNKGAQKIKGYTEAEIAGKHFSIFYLPEDAATGIPKQLLTQASEYNKATHEGWRVRKDGTRFWSSTVITALHNTKGEIIGFSKVTRDLTQKKEADDFIIFQNKQLEEYAYVASHDLQEPLRKIMMFGNMLQDKIPNMPEANSIIDKINYSAERMGKLIRDVLTYSQIKSGDNLFETVALDEIIKNIEIDFELLLKERKGKILYQKLPVIHAIPIQMHQLFANLISNAIKFNDHNPEVRITAEQVEKNDRAYFKFVVSDNGIGFDPQSDERMFSMFHRLPSDKKGTGIGLALCKKIAENHGGSIDVASKPGSGTAFTILIAANEPIKNL